MRIPSRGAARPTRIKVSPRQGWILTVLTGLPVLLGFVLPTGFLFWRAVQYAAQQTVDAGLVSGRSLQSSSSGWLSRSLPWSPGADHHWPAHRAAFAQFQPDRQLGYAIPGTVLVLSIFPGDALVGPELGAVGIGLAVSETLAGIVFALVVRFLASESARPGWRLTACPARLTGWPASMA